MIGGIGLDLVEVRRVQRLLDRHGQRFLVRCFCPGEVRRATDAEHLAGLLAAKEAAYKALSLRRGDGAGWRSFRVIRPSSSGPPRLELLGTAQRRAVEAGIVHAHLSITHHGGMAAAVVILES